MLTLFGATGYTGRMAALYLRDNAPDDLEWAIAARNPTKLAAVHAELGERGAKVKTIIADSSDPASIDAMVAQSTVIVTTAGPFALYGTPVVEACVRHGVHYCDITGESPWVRDMIDAHHEAAAASGTRIVPFCGMDSVPSDIGAMFVVDHIREELGQGTREVRCGVKFKGGVSGGTIASAINMGAQGETRRLGDPVLLNPKSHRSDAARKANRDAFKPYYDDALGAWTAPFAMAPVNTRVVRRSAALDDLADESWGPDFRYFECMRVSSRAKALMIAGGMGAFAAMLSNAPGRAVLGKLMPNPGQGPDEAALASGFMNYAFVGVAEDGSHVMADMKAQGDPGYRVTIMLLCEAGLALALSDDLPGGPERGGVLTPATALGKPYLQRLRAGGLTMEVR